MSNIEQTPEISENEQIAQRRAKLAQMRAEGIAYPNDFRRTDVAGCLHKRFGEKSHDELEALHEEVTIAGRMMLRRLMGKASFLHLQDMTGRIQIYARQDDLPEGLYETLKQWDIGDIIGVKGTLFKTKTGELSIKAMELRLLTKALRPLPDKFHGLTDQELRYRQRYLDLIMNEESRHVFKIRSKLISALREYLNKKYFIEMETPMMQVLAGGAAARPFVTHHHALDMELYLRIAPELNLKRLVVGGFEQVYEINRNFRNEGISTRHNPEFTMLEFYWAYADYHDLMDLTEDMFKTVAQQVLGSTTINYQNITLDFSKPFVRMTVLKSILHYNKDITLNMLHDENALHDILRRLGVPFQPNDGLGKLQMAIFDNTVEHLLEQPTFITAYPTEISPLARRNDQDPSVTDRFELFIAGRELANGFSELNDADDQAERLRAQLKEREAGDHEAMPYDEDYVMALEYGLPPTAGEGIGIDRLAMLFTNAPSIRDVILFPHMRPKL